MTPDLYRLEGGENQAGEVNEKTLQGEEKAMMKGEERVWTFVFSDFSVPQAQICRQLLELSQGSAGT